MKEKVNGPFQLDDYSRGFTEGQKFGYKEGWNDCIRTIIKDLRSYYDATRIMTMLNGMWKK